MKIKKEKQLEEEYSTAKVERIVPLNFRADVEALEGYIGRTLECGLCIETTITELLQVIPRKRKRTDAYDTFVKYLKKEWEIELVITGKND